MATIIVRCVGAFNVCSTSCSTTVSFTAAPQQSLDCSLLGCCGVIVAVVAVVIAFGGEAFGTVGTLEDFMIWPGSDLGGEEL